MLNNLVFRISLVITPEHKPCYLIPWEHPLSIKEDKGTVCTTSNTPALCRIFEPRCGVWCGFTWWYMCSVLQWASKSSSYFMVHTRVILCTARVSFAQTQWVEILHFHCTISKKECQNNQLTPNCIILTMKREAFTSPSQVSHGTDAISKAFPESCDGSLDFFLIIGKEIFQVAL